MYEMDAVIVLDIFATRVEGIEDSYFLKKTYI